MRKKRTRLRWLSILRRGAALFVALATVWLLCLTADFGAAAQALAGLADNAGLATALLSAELGSTGEEPLAGLDKLAVAQSSLLSANLEAVARWLEDHENIQQPEESSKPEPSQTPAPSPSVDPNVPTTSAPDDIVGRTMVPGSSSRYVSQDGLYIYNYTDYSLDIAQLAADCPDLNLSQAEGPQILIYHSHTTEAYTMDGTDIYEESDDHRTTDPNFNTIRIGEEMKEVFEAAGLEVIHDDTLYDYPVYSGAYDRSAEGIAAILEKYPSIQLVLDVHRDALVGEDGTVYKAVTRIDGVDTAQVMLVLGSSEGGEHPNWMQNLSLACRIQESMNTLYPTLARPMTMRSSRYNQQLSNGSLLVEVGTHGNTLQEALAGARLFARAAGQVLLGLKE